MASPIPAISRQWQILRCIPRYPKKITTKQIKSYLENTLLAIDNLSLRTIQRDLESLSTMGFMLHCDDRDKPYGWSWHKDAPIFDIAGLNSAEAIVFALAEQYLTQIMPKSSLDVIEPHFSAARRILNNADSHGNWLEKVTVIPPNQPLIPPHILPEIQQTVSEALLLGRQLEIRYKKKASQSDELYIVHPFAVVQRGYVMYLSARLFNYPDIRILAMHRITAAHMQETPIDIPEDYSLEQQKETGVWQFGNGEKIKVDLQFYESKAIHLYETPLSEDQLIEVIGSDNKQHRVTATVADTPQLRWWILGFADGVEVIGPMSLRQEMTQLSFKMASRYGTPEVAVQ